VSYKATDAETGEEFLVTVEPEPETLELGFGDAPADDWLPPP
jgi:hypothetical protein